MLYLLAEGMQGWCNLKGAEKYFSFTAVPPRPDFLSRDLLSGRSFCKTKPLYRWIL